jgi:cytochrome P450
MKLPPEVPGLPAVGNYLELSRGPLAFFSRVAREYGDVARVQLGPLKRCLVSDPELVGEILVTNAKLYTKDAFNRDLRAVLGNGLLTSDGDFWKRQRRLAQPPFHAKRVAGYAATFVERTSHAVRQWKDGQVLDVHEEMMHITLEIVGKTLFGADVADTAVEVGHSLEAVLARSLDLSRRVVPLMDSLPLPKNRRFARAIARLNEIVFKMIADRRRELASSSSAAAQPPREDLLAMLMQAKDDDGTSMSDTQLRDEVMTLFLAGHETTAIALSWTLYLLSQYPNVERELVAHIKDALGEREPTAADVPELKLVERVVMEAMRLLPPAWSLGREALVDTTIGGFDIPKGTDIWIVPWALHTDARWFSEPVLFRPSRFEGDWQKLIPKHAYIPFGAGPRLCIGISFAMLEATLMLTTILQRFSLTLVPGHPIVPLPSVTLRHKYGVRMTVHARA